jgi:hypothetical protein
MNEDPVDKQVPRRDSDGYVVNLLSRIQRSRTHGPYPIPTSSR